MAKETDLQLLTDTQLEIMNFVWQHGSATVADVWKEMSATRDLARNTVQTMMVRLEERGVLNREVEGLPSTAAMTQFEADGRFLTRPEIAVLI